MGLIMTLIAQFIKTGFKIRLVLAQLEGRQNPTIVGTVATVVEQRNIPVGAEGVQELQQRPRRFRKLEAEQPLLQRFGRSAADHIAHMELGHFVIGKVNDAVAAIVQ